MAHISRITLATALARLPFGARSIRIAGNRNAESWADMLGNAKWPGALRISIAGFMATSLWLILYFGSSLLASVL
ncbi:MAG: hypothetical protein U0988_06990 [Allopontixanthobacter sp.]|nr:hypothetical protein [Allopontixanthobacter sp.]